MTRVIGATPWRRGSSVDGIVCVATVDAIVCVATVDAIVCVATIAHSQWKSLVTWTDLSNGHIDEHVGDIKSATSV